MKPKIIRALPLFFAISLYLTPATAQSKHDCLVRQDPGYPVQEIKVLDGAPADFTLTERVQIVSAENRICAINEKCYIARGDYLELYRHSKTNFFVLHHKDSRDKLLNTLRLELTKSTTRSNFLVGMDRDKTEYFLMYLGPGSTSPKRQYLLETFPIRTPLGVVRPSDARANWEGTCEAQGGSGNGFDPPDFP